MKTLKFLMLSIICFSLQGGCPGETFDETPDGTLKVKNNFTVDIFIHQWITENNPVTYLIAEQLVLSLKELQETTYQFKNLTSNLKYRLFIYKKSTLEANTWQEIKDQGLYDKRYDLTLDQLKALNYEIVYTGL
jgi:hypothetical protein